MGQLSSKLPPSRTISPPPPTLPRSIPTANPSLLKWSAPCFVKLGAFGVGLGLGRTLCRSFTICMTQAMRAQLTTARQRGFAGMDLNVVCGSTMQDRADFISAPATSAGSVGANLVQGALVDLVFSSGSLAVDAARNREAYGVEHPVGDLLGGKVEAPSEMSPLYAALNAIVNSIERTSAPSISRASLDRATLGVDPDQRGVVLADGSLLDDARIARESTKLL